MGWLIGSLAAALQSPVPLHPPAFAILSTMERQRDHTVGISLSDGSRMEVLCSDFRREEVRLVAKPSTPPGYLIRCKAEGAGERKLVIWYHGGPWAFAGENLVLEQLAFLEAGYEIFIPFYPGSSDRPFEVQGKRMTPDVVDAAAEAKTIHSWATASYKIVDVVGESFGAYLAASLSREIARTFRILYLINPSLGGESPVQRLYNRERQRLKVSQFGGAPEQNVSKLTHIYFRRFGNYDPLRELRSTPNLKLKLIYGGADNLLNRKEVSRLKSMIDLTCGVEYRPRNGNEFGHTRQDLQGVRRLLACGDSYR